MSELKRTHPALVYMLLAAFWANLSVLCFYRQDWTGVWSSFGCLFLTYELYAAFRKILFGTLSERIWIWLGINPPRRWRKARVTAAGVFVGEFLLHVVSGGQSWWSGGTAIVTTAVPVGIVIGYAIIRERGEAPA